MVIEGTVILLAVANNDDMKGSKILVRLVHNVMVMSQMETTGIWMITSANKSKRMCTLINIRAYINIW